VVGDFGPPKQEEQRFDAEDNFGLSFDVSSIQPDQDQVQDQTLMMPPHIGKLLVFRKIIH
jgi:hypothetical protein